MPEYLKWLNDYEVVKSLNKHEYLSGVTSKEIKKYFQNIKNSKSDLLWAICLRKNHKFIGTIKVGSINNFSRTCDIGIMIGDKTEWGKGYAQDSLKVVCNYLFQKLLIRKLNSGTMSINQPMIKTFLNLGFKKEGLFRNQDKFEDNYCDHIYFGCFENEFKF